MCICINCFYYNICSLNLNLEIIQTNKDKKLTTAKFKLHPNFAVVNLNIFSQQLKDELEFDVIECNSFLEKPKMWILSKRLKKS
jgi:hypothetical protein